jgi:tRNA G18 (ribose-2'-O)-methylase SpoU
MCFFGRYKMTTNNVYLNNEQAEKVDSLNHHLAIRIRSLLSRIERQSMGEILIDDEENILQAIDAGLTITNIFESEKKRLSAHVYKKLPSTVAVNEIAIRTSKKIFGNDNVARIFAIAELPKQLQLDSFFNSTKDIIILDKLSITGNIGSIIRTAVAFNIGGIVILGADYIDIYDRRIIRASRGYIFKIPIVSTATNEVIQFCRKKNFHILATSPYAEKSINNLSFFKEKLAIVFGSEKEGCSKQLFENADTTVKIPISSEVESLNVSVAAAITLYIRSYRQENHQNSYKY